MTVQIIDAGHALPARAVEQQLEFLGDLVVRIVGGNVQRRVRRAVEVDHRVGMAVTPGGDRLEGDQVIDRPLAGERQAGGLHRIVVADARAGVEDAGQDVRSGKGAGHFAVSVPGIGVVLHVIEGQAEEQVRGRGQLDADAGGQNVLVIVLCAGGQVGSEAVALIAGDRRADAQHFAQRRRAGDDQVLLVIGADRGADGQFGLGRDARRHVLDGAADGVAAVQRALGPAQHLDALDVEDVEHRALGAGDIDVVHIKSHAGLEAPKRILLADTADEADQGGVGAARDLDRGVGALLLQDGDVRGAGLLQALGAEGRHCDRNLPQGFLAAAGGDDDFVHLGGLRGHGRSLLNLGGRGCGRDAERAESGAGQEDGFHKLVHGRPQPVCFQGRRYLFSVQ